jgi:hypothetical protein
MSLTRAQRLDDAVTQSAVLLDRILRALSQGDAEAIRACIARGILRLAGLLDEPALANTLRYFPGNAAMARTRFGAAKTKLRASGALDDPRAKAALIAFAELLARDTGGGVGAWLTAAGATEALGSLPRLDALHAMATACVDPVVCASWDRWPSDRLLTLLGTIGEATGDQQPYEDAVAALDERDAILASWPTSSSQAYGDVVRRAVACPVVSDYLAAIAEGAR